MLITLKLWKSRKLKNVSFLFLALHCCMIYGQQKTIVIDPGHGGKDSGALGLNSVLEKDVVLDIANEILNLNKSLFHNEVDIYLTRYTDTLISLSDRSRLAKSLKADVFVSLHCNHSDNLNARGVEVYVHKLVAPNIKASIGLGLSILDESTQKLGFKKRGVKFANFQVLRETTFCPSILVEMGFMTNVDEADYFLKPKNVRAMALAVLMGTVNYLNIEL